MEQSQFYDKDFYAWCFQQAQLLEEKNFSELDIQHIIEELESMGRSERMRLESYFTVLLLHLLKWKYQPEYVGEKSWKLSIDEHRFRAKKLIKQNPSLKGNLWEIMDEAYRLSRINASEETKLDIDTFPTEIPFTLEELLQDDWMPS